MRVIQILLFPQNIPKNFKKIKFIKLIPQKVRTLKKLNTQNKKNLNTKAENSTFSKIKTTKIKTPIV